MKSILPYLKTSALVSFSKVLSSGLNLLFMIYSVNLLSRTENGSFQYYLSYLPILLAIAEFGLPSALVKFMSKKAENGEKVGSLLVASLWIKLYSLVLLFLLGIGFFFWTDNDALIISILILGAVVLSFVSLFESILVSFRDYLVMAIWTPLPNLVRFLFLFLIKPILPYPISFIEILIIFCLAPLFILSIFFILFRNKSMEWTSSFSDQLPIQKEMLLFNSWAFIASIFAILSDRMEIFFLNVFHPTEVVADYGTALQLFSGFLIILSTFNSIVYPKLARIAGTFEFQKVVWQSVGIGAILALLLSPGYFLAEFILKLLFGIKYVNSIPVFHILYPNFLLQLVFAPLGIALFALGKPKILAFLAFLRFVFGLILDNWIIPDGGAKGAGFALLLGQVIPWFILLLYFTFHFNKNQNRPEYASS